MMEEIAFSVRLNKMEGSTLELFIREHWLAKKLLNNSPLSLLLLLLLLLLLIYFTVDKKVLHSFRKS